MCSLSGRVFSLLKEHVINFNLVSLKSMVGY
jgi:hypothetical protein